MQVKYAYSLVRGGIALRETRQDNERSQMQTLQCLQVRISTVATQINNIHFILLKTLIDLPFQLVLLSNQTQLVDWTKTCLNVKGNQ